MEDKGPRQADLVEREWARPTVANMPHPQYGRWFYGRLGAPGRRFGSEVSGRGEGGGKQEQKTRGIHGSALFYQSAFLYNLFLRPPDRQR
ncbi:hypothetical protein LBMAG57_24620 [Verrucomicrobiota bacterium]|nr:hypothetical protein LBMAG57_24620 [Verrucomicrobiota bacterium]